MSGRRGVGAGGVLGRLSVLAFSLLLLTYIAYGEAHRVFPRMVLKRLAAQGEIIQGSVETLLRAGLPLEQFAGFTSLASSLLESDEAAVEVRLVEAQGLTLSSRVRPGMEPVRGANFHLAPPAPGSSEQPFVIEEAEHLWRLGLPLRSRFEQVGRLEVFVPKAILEQSIRDRFRWVMLSVGSLLALNALLLVVRRQRGTGPSFTLPYTLSFLTQAVVCLTALGHLQSGAILEETRSLARSLGHRLETATQLGVELAELEGIGRAFAEYARRNPDIHGIELLDGNTVLIDTDAARVGKPWEPNVLLFEHPVVLATPDGSQRLRLVVGIPKLLVLKHLWRSGKNSLVLLLAAGLLSAVLLRAVGSDSERGKGKGKEQEEVAPAPTINPPGAEGDVLRHVELAWFLGCFMDGLSLSFLPQYFQQLAKTNALQASTGALLFSVTFAANLLALLPAGRMADYGKMHRLMRWGLFLSAISWLALAAEQRWGMLLLVRALAGVGQAMLVTGTQAYVLKLTSSTDRVRGSTVVPSGYNGGLLSGMVIGALLVAYIGPSGVFMAAGCTGLLAIISVLALLPRLRHIEPRSRPPAGLMRGLSLTLRDGDLLRVLLLVGIPNRVVLAGVLMFALPLLLSRQQYVQEDVGQILMFYSLAVLISNRWLAGGGRRNHTTISLLYRGLLASGVGLLLIGMMDWSNVKLGEAGLKVLEPLVPIIGLWVLGLGHGFILAPSVAHAAASPSAAELGEGLAATLYRLLERVGQVAGPPLVGLLLTLGHQSALTFAWLGGAMVLGSFFFIFGRKSAPTT